MEMRIKPKTKPMISPKQTDVKEILNVTPAPTKKAPRLLQINSIPLYLLGPASLLAPASRRLFHDWIGPAIRADIKKPTCPPRQAACKQETNRRKPLLPEKAGSVSSREIGPAFRLYSPPAGGLGSINPFFHQFIQGPVRFNLLQGIVDLLQQLFVFLGHGNAVHFIFKIAAD